MWCGCHSAPNAPTVPRHCQYFATPCFGYPHRVILRVVAPCQFWVDDAALQGETASLSAFSSIGVRDVPRVLTCSSNIDLSNDNQFETLTYSKRRLS